MITFNTTENGINILYKNQIIIKHSKDKPAFFLGSGLESIESYRGNYKIEDYIETRIPLSSFQLINGNITFSNQEIELRLECVEENNRLIINFFSNQPLNRFWMRIFATKDEKIYGCGEQASYFNLRTRNFPLWTSEPGVGRDKKSLTTFYADLKDKAGGDYYTTYYPEPTFVSSR